MKEKQQQLDVTIDMGLLQLEASSHDVLIFDMGMGWDTLLGTGANI